MMDFNTLGYPIIIREDFDGLAEALQKADLWNRKICVISDENVAALYARDVSDRLAAFSQDVHLITFPPGEGSKNLETIEMFYRRMTDLQMDRRSVVAALGGGVTGDMAGFAAATFMRGIAHVQMPTSLLAQVDSSVGGKVGVDFMGHKNLIGAFYRPALVYVALQTLATLPEVQLASGMGEVIKHGLIASKAYYDMLVRDREKIRGLDMHCLRAVVEGSCRIKSEVVSQDEKELGFREVLNFGHTFGHAIETLSQFQWPHGHCVAVGMTAALYASMQRDRAGIQVSDLEDIKELLQFWALPVKAPYAPADIYDQMRFDKKNKEGKINLILLRAAGQPYTEKNARDDEILDALRGITQCGERDVY
ncbi:MAG: 3-dehydroquinate synthase [Clostridiales bacterium]|jgi:3-dehydroquinate synthase|nr:3-dehydroquinate synthase [Clostridiales bacterium]